MTEIKELIGKRDRLHGIFTKTRNHDDWRKFTVTRNQVKSELKYHVHNEVIKRRKNTGFLWKNIKNTAASKERESVFIVNIQR